MEASVTISLRATAEVQVIPRAVRVRINRLAEERVKCRKEKNWQRADEIRNKLAELGVTLEDTKAKPNATLKPFTPVPSEESLDSLMKELGVIL